MKARAPGKLVLSGAYAVLEGAPAIVSAVDRYVLADAARPADRVTNEVAAALPAEQAPWFDATPLRQEGKKLGLGSSAAILVASLAARRLLEGWSGADAELARLVFEPALAAHSRAQSGGSGVDVAVSAFGGTQVFRRGAGGPELRAVALPDALSVETWWSREEASTPALVARVRALGAARPAAFRDLMGAQARAAEDACAALLGGDTAALVAALAAQRHALAALGDAAGSPIVTPVTRELGEIAEASGGTALPAGAGGGDVVVFAGLAASSVSFRALAARSGLVFVPLVLGARGVHAVAVESRDGG